MPKGERPSPDVYNLIELSDSAFNQLAALSSQFNPEEDKPFHPELDGKIKGVLQPFFQSVRQELAVVQSKVNPPSGSPTRLMGQDAVDFKLYSADAKKFSTGLYSAHDRPQRDKLQLIIGDSQFSAEVFTSLMWSTDHFSTLVFETEVNRNNATRALNLKIEQGFSSQANKFHPYLSVTGKSSRVHQVNGFENSFYIRATSLESQPFLPMDLLR